MATKDAAWSGALMSRTERHALREGEGRGAEVGSGLARTGPEWIALVRSDKARKALGQCEAGKRRLRSGSVGRGVAGRLG